jgi:hypothetical protein
MYGFTADPIDSLQNLTLSWNYPPPLKHVSGAEQHGFDPDQRAYILSAENSEIGFDLIGSKVRPVYHPCFVIKNWTSGNKAEVIVNGQNYSNGSSLRQGIVRDTDGKRMLVVWLKMQTEGVNHVKISQVL